MDGLYCLIFDVFYMNSHFLAWYLWLRQDDIKGKKVLELGSGTALPGLLCAKFGAEKVFLSDDAWQEDTLKNIREAVKINNFSDSEKVSVEGTVYILGQ